MKAFLIVTCIVLSNLTVFAQPDAQTSIDEIVKKINTKVETERLENLYSKIENMRKWCANPAKETFAYEETHAFAEDFAKVHNDATLELQDAIEVSEHLISQAPLWGAIFGYYPKKVYTKTE